MKKIFLSLSVLFYCGCSSIPDLENYFPPITSPEINSSESIGDNNNNDNNSSTNQEIKKIKVYINPSVQINNMYYNNEISEAAAMNNVSNIIYTSLKDNPRFIVYHNDRMLSLKESVIESNKLNVDYHIALHTNAGGGSGSECYYYNDKSFANSILKSFDSYHSFPKRGLKDGSHLYELKNITAKNKALIEFLFHDNKIESKFIQNNYNLLAMSIVESLLKIK